ncbi:hypothetical protein V2J09_018033 [Rumex salicifolius]
MPKMMQASTKFKPVSLRGEAQLLNPAPKPRYPQKEREDGEAREKDLPPPRTIHDLRGEEGIEAADPAVNSFEFVAALSPPAPHSTDL